MGGHNAGEVAAKEAVRFVCASIEELFVSAKREWNIFDLSSFNKLCIENANSWVHHLGKKKKDYSGMGTHPMYPSFSRTFTHLWSRRR